MRCMIPQIRVRDPHHKAGNNETVLSMKEILFTIYPINDTNSLKTCFTKT